jgi:hypothetical protein
MICLASVDHSDILTIDPLRVKSHKTILDMRAKIMKPARCYHTSENLLDSLLAPLLKACTCGFPTIWAALHDTVPLEPINHFLG